MLYTLRFLKFNNYYNRRVKILPTIDDYLEYEMDDLAPLERCSFNPNDFVNASHEFNCPNNLVPDYVLVIENEEPYTVTRWFVVSSFRRCNGQFHLNLRRDIIADHYSVVKNAECFIEKGAVRSTDVAIFNKEGTAHNRIKTDETLLKDIAGCGWIVGYIPRDAFNAEAVVTVDLGTTLADMTITSFDDWKFSNCINSTHVAAGHCEPRSLNKDSLAPTLLLTYANGISYKISDIYTLTYGWNNVLGNMLYGTEAAHHIEDDTVVTAGYNPVVYYHWNSYNPADLPASAVDAFNAAINWNAYRDQAFTALSSWLTTADQSDTMVKSTDEAELLQLNGKKILDSSTNKRYMITVSRNHQFLRPSISDFYDYAFENATNSLGLEVISNKVGATTPHISIFSFGPSLLNELKAALTALTGSLGIGTSNSLNDSIEQMASFAYVLNTYSVTIEEITDNVKVTVPAAGTRTHLQDSPYDMYIMPYNPIAYRKGSTDYVSQRFASLMAAIGIPINFETIQAGSGTKSVGTQYDLQLLPYCPISIWDEANQRFDISNYTSYDITDSADAVIGFMIWCDKSDFDVYLDKQLTVTDIKVENELDSFRLLAPNYNASYDFSAAQNRGVDYFTAHCSYKPFSPLIYVTPHYNADGLYGNDYKDGRGLVITGNCSLPQLSSAYANYQISNSNYQNIFDREIKTLELKQDASRFTGWLGVGMAAGGAIAGGAALGKSALGVVGGLASAAAGAAKMAVNEGLMQNELSQAKDMFAYNIANIEAQPYNLTSVGSFTCISKIFPILEAYSCKEEERTAFKKNLALNGMTVMRPGTVQDCILAGNTYADDIYVKAKLIRIADEADLDFNQTTAIAYELDRGLYFPKEN